MGILEDTLNRWGIERPDLKGAALFADLPFSDALLNRLLARRLAAHENLGAIRISARDGDQVLVTLQPKASLLPSLDVILRIQQQPDLPRDPTLRLRYTAPAVGLFARLAGPLIAAFKRLPEGIVVNGDEIAVDLYRLLSTHGHQDLISVVRRLEVHTRAGAVVMQIETGI